jgi:hypothetical protein
MITYRTNHAEVRCNYVIVTDIRRPFCCSGHDTGGATIVLQAHISIRQLTHDGTINAMSIVCIGAAKLCTTHIWICSSQSSITPVQVLNCDRNYIEQLSFLDYRVLSLH